MTEQQIQSKIIKKLESEGWYVVKLIKTNKNGIPDLLAIKESKTVFIEVKKPKVGVLSPLQDYRIKELQSHGITAKVCTSESDI